MVNPDEKFKYDINLHQEVVPQDSTLNSGKGIVL